MSSISLYPYPTLAPGDATDLTSDGYSIVRTVAAPPVALSPRRRSVLSRRMRLLVLGTIAFNTTEAVVAVWAGMAASATVLISAIEVTSGLAVAWQFARPGSHTRERAALRVIAASFVALTVYVTVEAVRLLHGGQLEQPNTLGVTLAVLSLLIVPALCFAQRRTGRELGSASAVADSRQTLLCTYLSGALLIGLLLEIVTG